MPPATPQTPGQWWSRRFVKLPLWAWIIVVLRVIGIIGFATNKKAASTRSVSPVSTVTRSTVPSTTIRAVTTATTTPTTPAVSSAPATTASTVPPTTRKASGPASATCGSDPTTTSNPVIENGVYLVSTEIAPGLYRVGQFRERRDAEGNIIDNDFTDGCPTIVDVLPTDHQIKIDGKAIAVDPRQPYDPIARGCSAGTFLVGVDIQPGRYKVTPDAGQTSYWARFDKNFALIDNDLGQSQLILTIKSGDFAIKIEGSLTPG